MLDTNILLDWLLQRDTTRLRHIERLFQASTELHIPDMIIIEMVYVLEKFYKLPGDVVIANVHAVLDNALFNCNRALFARVTGMYVEQPSWSFVDTCLIGYSQLQKVGPVWTFDKQLAANSSNRARTPN